MHMKNMTVGNIAKACGGKLFGDEKIILKHPVW